MKKQPIIAVIAILVLVGLGWVLVGKNRGEKPVPSQTTSPTATTTLSAITKVDEHLTIDETLRDVNFCGKTYKVKQVMIDRVDVVQRIAEILTKNLIPAVLDKGPLVSEEERNKGKMILKEGELAKSICGNVLAMNAPFGGTIEATVKKSFSGVDRGLNEEIYPVSMGVSPVSAQTFYVALLSGSIYIDDGFSGTFIGPIGKLK